MRSHPRRIQWRTLWVAEKDKWLVEGEGVYFNKVTTAPETAELIVAKELHCRCCW